MEIKKKKYTEKNFSAELNYSKKSIDEKLIKLKIKGSDNVEIPLEYIVGIALDNMHMITREDLKMKIFDTNINEVQMIEVDRNLTAELAEDAKAGDKISLKVRDKMPFTYALILDLLGTEKEFNSIKISRDELIAHFETLPENIKNNLRLLFEKEVKNV
jgi:hypothetical protein